MASEDPEGPPRPTPSQEVVSDFEAHPLRCPTAAWVVARLSSAFGRWQLLVGYDPPGNGNGQAFPGGLCHLASWQRKEHSHPGQGLSPSAPGRVWWLRCVPWSEGASWRGRPCDSWGAARLGQEHWHFVKPSSFVGRSSSILCSDPCPSLQRPPPGGITQLSRVTWCLVPAGFKAISVQSVMLNHCLYV